MHTISIRFTVEKWCLERGTWNGRKKCWKHQNFVEENTVDAIPQFSNCYRNKFRLLVCLLLGALSIEKKKIPFGPIVFVVNGFFFSFCIAKATSSWLINRDYYFFSLFMIDSLSSHSFTKNARTNTNSGILLLGCGFLNGQLNTH